MKAVTFQKAALLAYRLQCNLLVFDCLAVGANSEIRPARFGLGNCQDSIPDTIWLHWSQKQIVF